MTHARGWTLRQQVHRASLVMLVLLATLFTVILVSIIDFKSKGDDVINRWQPAFTTSQDVLADLVNQETGVRGYTLGRNQAFLQPYRDYHARQRTHEAALTKYLSGRAGLVDALQALHTSAESWRSAIAQPFIVRVGQGDPTVADAASSTKAKVAFDKIRAAAAILTDDIRSVRDKAKSDRTHAVALVWIALGVSAAVILAAGYVLSRGLRKSVLEPVEALAGQTRDVAQGSVSKKIVAGGPPEIAGLGRDVDTMRAQIVSELARVESARVVLIERSADLARSNADLEQFAYVASHDLSEPLRKVANFCQLLERQYSPQLDDKAKQYIAFAVDGAKRMQMLITDLLSFSRVGRTTETFESVDTGDVLNGVLANLDDRIVAADAEIVRTDLPVVFGDPTLLTAVFQNLLGNSLKYRSDERRLCVEVSAEYRDDGWIFTVSDNGIGIERQYSERIFAIFQRLHLRDQYGGTGIGLALCRKIVEFHRGRIWLAEKADHGATFQFTIPEQLAMRDTVDTDERRLRSDENVYERRLRSDQKA